MEWSNVYYYLRRNVVDGFFGTCLNRRAKRELNNNEFSCNMSDFRTLLRIMRKLVEPIYWFESHRNMSVTAVIHNYLKNCATDAPRIIISEHSRDITNSFNAIENFPLEENGITSDKTAAITLTTSRYDRIKVLRKNNTVVIFTNRNITGLEYIGCMRRIIAMFPRWFTVKPDTTDIWMSLIEDTPDNFYNYLAAYFNEHSTQSVEQFIETFKTLGLRSIEARKQQLGHSIANHKRDIENYYNHITTLWKQIYDLQEQQAGINADTYIETGVELIKYIDKRPGITLDHLSESGTLELSIVSELRFFDQEAARRVIQNQGGGIVRQLLTDVFIKNKYQFQIGTAVQLNLDPRNGEIVHADTANTIDSNTIWNPHLYHYNCWGSNKTEIRKAVEAQQLIAAVEQIYAATCSINILDGAVWSRFIRTLSNALIADDYSDAIGNRNCKCLKNVQTGECITLAQYKETIEKGDE